MADGGDESRPSVRGMFQGPEQNEHVWSRGTPMCEVKVNVNVNVNV